MATPPDQVATLASNQLSGHVARCTYLWHLHRSAGNPPPVDPLTLLLSAREKSFGMSVTTPFDWQLFMKSFPRGRGRARRVYAQTPAGENMFPIISAVLKLPRLGAQSSDSGRPLIDPRLRCRLRGSLRSKRPQRIGGGLIITSRKPDACHTLLACYHTCLR